MTEREFDTENIIGVSCSFAVRRTLCEMQEMEQVINPAIIAA